MAIQEIKGNGIFPVFTGTTNLSPDLVCWQKIRDAYHRYPTQESIERIRGLQLASRVLEKEGFKAGLFIGGSLAFGQSKNESDVDVFGVITEGEKYDYGAIIAGYRNKLHSEIGKDVKISFKDTLTFPINSLEEYLDNEEFVKNTQLDFYSDIRWESFHTHYQTCLRIGESNIPLIERIEGLKSDQTIARALIIAGRLSSFATNFAFSFAEYQWRLSSHRDFCSLSNPQQKVFMDSLEENQQQFLFYIRNPRFCQI